MSAMMQLGQCNVHAHGRISLFSHHATQVRHRNGDKRSGLTGCLGSHATMDVAERVATDDGGLNALA